MTLLRACVRGGNRRGRVSNTHAEYGKDTVGIRPIEQEDTVILLLGEKRVKDVGYESHGRRHDLLA